MKPVLHFHEMSCNLAGNGHAHETYGGVSTCMQLSSQSAQGTSTSCIAAQAFDVASAVGYDKLVTAYDCIGVAHAGDQADASMEAG